MPEGPGYFRLQAPLGETFTPGVQWIQVRLEVLEVGPFCWGPYVSEGTPAPYFDNVAIRAWSTVTGLSQTPHVLALEAHPNPFNPRVTITYHLPRPGRLELVLYDVSGRQLRTLFAGWAEAGVGQQVWDGMDASGRGAAAGMYFARLKARGEERVLKLTLVR